MPQCLQRAESEGRVRLGATPSVCDGLLPDLLSGLLPLLLRARHLLGGERHPLDRELLDGRKGRAEDADRTELDERRDEQRDDDPDRGQDRDRCRVEQRRS